MPCDRKKIYKEEQISITYGKGDHAIPLQLELESGGNIR